MLDDFSASPLSFVPDKVNELAPTYIIDRLGKVAVLDHAFNVEVFQTDDAKAINDHAAGLVVKVFALVGNLFVNGRNGVFGSHTAVTALHLAAQPTLAYLQPAFGSVQVFWIVDLLVSTENGEVLQTQIDANRFGLLHWFSFSRDLTLNRDKVFACGCAADGAILHLASNATVANNFHPADLRQVDFFAIELEALGIADRLGEVLALELGIVGSTFKKIDVGSVKVFQRLLQDLAICLFEKVVFGLESIRQIVSAIDIGQARIGLEVVFFPHPPIVVIHKAGATKLNRQRFLLFFGWVYAKFVRFENLHELLTFLTFDIALDDFNADGSTGGDEFAASPKAGQSTLQPSKFFSELMSGKALDFANHIGRRKGWRDGQKQMDVIGHDLSFNHAVTVFFLLFQNQFFHPNVYAIDQNGTAKLGTKYYMVLAAMYQRRFTDVALVRLFVVHILSPLVDIISNEQNRVNPSNVLIVLKHTPLAASKSVSPLYPKAKDIGFYGAFL